MYPKAFPDKFTIQHFQFEPVVPEISALNIKQKNQQTIKHRVCLIDFSPF